MLSIEQMWRTYPEVTILQSDDVSRIICDKETIPIQSIHNLTCPPFSLLRLLDNNRLNPLTREVSYIYKST